MEQLLNGHRRVGWGWFAVAIVCSSPLPVLLAHAFIDSKPYKCMMPAVPFEGLVAACVAIAFACAEVSRRRSRRYPHTAPLVSIVLTAIATVVVDTAVFVATMAIGGGEWSGDFGWGAAAAGVLALTGGWLLFALPLAAAVGFAGRAWGRDP
jgi:hypothetical protein